MIDWKSVLFTTGFAAIKAARADQWLRRAAQGSGVILAFHRVRPWLERSFAPNRFLEVTPDFLDRVITLLDEQAQILGLRKAEISKRIDIVAAALFQNAAVEDLNDMDLSYTPPFSSPWDPIQIAAQTWVAAARDAALSRKVVMDETAA
jgi:hypothetical protein